MNPAERPAHEQHLFRLEHSNLRHSYLGSNLSHQLCKTQLWKQLNRAAGCIAAASCRPVRCRLDSQLGGKLLGLLWQEHTRSDFRSDCEVRKPGASRLAAQQAQHSWLHHWLQNSTLRLHLLAAVLQPAPPRRCSLRFVFQFMEFRTLPQTASGVATCAGFSLFNQVA